LRDLIVLNAVPDAGEKGLLDVPVDVLERMTRQTTLLGRVELTRAADIVNTGLTEMRGATAPRLLLELMCARVLLPAAGDDEASLLVRLERLERRFAIAGDGPAAAPPVVIPAVAVPPPAPTLPPSPPTAPARPDALAEMPSAPVARAGVGDLDATAVRGLWDSILDVVKGLPRGRTTQPLIAMHAQVLDVRDDTLVLGFTTGPLERLFRTGGGEELLLQAIKQLLGVDWKISTTLSGAAATEAAPPTERVAPPPPSESMAADRAPPRSPTARNRPAAAPRSAAAEAAAATVGAEPEVEIVLDEARHDDADADDGASGLALLQRHLGATVINDGQNG
jgi:DNA polymerase-3 subunit gamma/tau